MRGYGGIIVAMLPNGSTVYFFSDGNEFEWRRPVLEAAKLPPVFESPRSP